MPALPACPPGASISACAALHATPPTGARPLPHPACSPQLDLEPTRQVLPYARSQGFSNVHDFLVHLVTGAFPPGALTW